MKSEEIARIAGVSRSTVSRVINNYPNVPEKTRERVMKIIREYHYEPNLSARVLAGKRTNTIGLFYIVSMILRVPIGYMETAFCPFVDAFVDIGNSMGYYMLVHTIYNPKIAGVSVRPSPKTDRRRHYYRYREKSGDRIHSEQIH